MIKPADHSKQGLLAIYSAVGAVFAALAVMVSTRSSGWLDEPVISLLAGHRSDFWTPVMKIFTSLGSTPYIVSAVLLLAVILLPRRRKYDLSLVVIGVIGAVTLNFILKAIFHRVRPSEWVHLVVENGQSFPSGHAMASSALALSIIYVLWRSRWRKLALTLGIIYVVAVGASRVYLGVHYPSDVMAGWCVSWLWVATAAYALNRYRSSHAEANQARKV